MSIGVVDGLQQVLFKACELAELLIESFDLLLEVDVRSELEEDAGGSEVGDSAAFGNILLVTNDDNLGAFSEGCKKVSLLSNHFLFSDDESVCTDLRGEVYAGGN